NPNPTLLNPASAASTYVGAWPHTNWIGPVDAAITVPPDLTESDIRAMVAAALREDSAIRAILGEVVDERLDKLARELHTNAAFQPTRPIVERKPGPSGVCWVCGEPGEEMATFERGSGLGRVLLHSTDECITAALHQDKEEMVHSSPMARGIDEGAG